MDHNIHGAIPLLLILLCWIPFCSPFAPPSESPLLTWNPPSCDRIRPPRSQVACKLTSPFSTLSPIPPPSKFPVPKLSSASLWRPQEFGFFCPAHFLLAHMVYLWPKHNSFINHIHTIAWYVYTRLTISEHMAQTPWRVPLIIPLALRTLPCSPVPLTYLESLLCMWCDPCPLWSQVACKLTSSPLPFPSPISLPVPQQFPIPIVCPSTTTSRHRLHVVRYSNVVVGGHIFEIGNRWGEGKGDGRKRGVRSVHKRPGTRVDGDRTTTQRRDSK
jgi:hypothetical protein